MIGIDFGTTRCKTAYVDPTGKPVIVTNARGEQLTPTAVCLPPSGEALIGTDAVEQSYIDPENSVRNFKLKLGTTENLLKNGQTLTATDAAALVIGRQKEDAERILGMAVTECVATHPANFRDDAKQALQEAFERNGIEVQKLVPEPTAAGYAYAVEKGKTDAHLLVYDFGGGTFDVSVLHVAGSQISVLATEGVRQLGGNDLTETLKQRVLNEVQAKCGKTPTVEEDPLFFLDLEQRAEAAKVSLGSRPEVAIVTAYQGDSVVVNVTQQEFHAEIGPLVNQSLEALDRAIAAASLKIDAIDRLILVGGTSRMPYIQNAVADHTGLVPKMDIDPDKAIAYGAALACVAEMARQGRTSFVYGQAIPASDKFVRDVTAHAVGCCVLDSRGSKQRLLNAALIPKNTEIPCHRSDAFCLEHDDQDQAQIEILQGEQDAERNDCLLIGELVLKDLPKEPLRTRRIHVEYVIDDNGMVTATATDKVGGAQQTVSVDYKKGIKASEKPAAA